RSVVYLRTFEGGAGTGGGSAEIEQQDEQVRPPVAPQPKSEGARVGPVMPKPSQRIRRGRAEGCTEERLPRRPAARSVVYRRAFEGVFGVY
ncbi:unnamed protein product, partial [Ectocarpus sp. 4 AP-2014]